VVQMGVEAGWGKRGEKQKRKKEASLHNAWKRGHHSGGWQKRPSGQCPLPWASVGWPIH